MFLAGLICTVSAVFGAGGATTSPFLIQHTVAPHGGGLNHGLPCMARLDDNRILLTWSRYKAGSEDWAVVGAFSADHGATWSEPRVLIDTPELLDADPSIVVSGKRVLVTCTTVTFAQGIHTSLTWCVRSEDNGTTWSEPYQIPMNHKYTCGKCHRGLRLKSGTLLMGYSWDVLCEQGQALQSEGQMDLRAGVMRSTVDGLTWTNGGDTTAKYAKIGEGSVSGTDEPAIVELEDGSIYMLMRTGSDHLYEARSYDEGKTWQDIKPSPLTGSNAPAAMVGFDAGGRRGVLVVWNNALQRQPLCAAVSFDGCRTWSEPKDIAFPYTGGQASYPSCVQSADGRFIAVWQQDVEGGRDVRCARFNIEWLLAQLDKIVLFGDSTTAPRNNVCVFGEILRERLPDMQIVNAGVPSDSTDLARSRFEKDVLTRKPKVVTIFFGLNDSAADVWRGVTLPRLTVKEYEDNLRHFVKTLKENGAKPILMTPNPLAWTDKLRELYGKLPYDVSSDAGFNVLLNDYVAAVRRVAESEKVTLIDVNAMFEEYAKLPGRSIHDILIDGMHPNTAGHKMIATALLKESLSPAEAPSGGNE